jgi:hypothetical protein
MVKSPNVVNKHRNAFIREMLFQGVIKHCYLDLKQVLVLGGLDQGSDGES